MTRTQRQALRKRKERNQQIWWWITDTVALVGLVGTCYGMMLIAYAVQG